MFQLKNIKIHTYGWIFGAITVFFFADTILDSANKFSTSDYYYWSKDVRNVASSIRTFANFLFLVSAIQMGIGIMALVLKNTGKYCPDCERIYSKSAIKCPRCKTDLTHAKSVKEYLAKKPKIIPKATPTILSRPPIIWKQNDHKKFCTYCGNELSVESAFCPHCGNKIN